MLTIRKWLPPLVASLALASGCSATAPPDEAVASASGPDCPASLSCQLNEPAYVDAFTRGDGTYNYTPALPDNQQRPIYGMVIHTVEGSAESASNMSKQAPARSSWNYLVKPDGSVEQSVPLTGVAYTAANRFFNTGYLQVEVAGYAGLCDLTDEQYESLSELGSYLGKRFGFEPGTQTVFGHDSVPGISNDQQASMNWDPGPCFDWQRLYASWGDEPLSGDASVASAVVIAPQFKGNEQPLTACTGDSRCDPERALATGLNFTAVHQQPSDDAPLLADPYLHPDGAGTAAINDWGAKALFGHRYAVADRADGWMGLWFAGQVGWVKNEDLAPASDDVRLVTPKGDAAPVYGRPMPTDDEFNASAIPDDIWQAQAIPARLAQYSFASGQAYAVVSEPVNAFYEGCDKTDCSAEGDGAVVEGDEQYLMIEFGHRFAFVKASDVTDR